MISFFHQTRTPNAMVRLSNPMDPAGFASKKPLWVHEAELDYRYRKPVCRSLFRPNSRFGVSISQQSDLEILNQTDSIVNSGGTRRCPLDRTDRIEKPQPVGIINAPTIWSIGQPGGRRVCPAALRHSIEQTAGRSKAREAICCFA